MASAGRIPFASTPLTPCPFSVVLEPDVRPLSMPMCEAFANHPTPWLGSIPAAGGAQPLRVGSQVVGFVEALSAEQYPNVADFISSAADHGIARRLTPVLPVQELTAVLQRAVPLLLIHPRGWIANIHPYCAAMDARRAQGVCGRLQGPVTSGELASLFVQDASHPGNDSEAAVMQRRREMFFTDLDGGVPISAYEPERVRRAIDGTDYEGYARPSHVCPHYSAGVVASYTVRAVRVIGHDGLPGFSAFVESLREAIALPVIAPALEAAA